MSTEEKVSKLLEVIKFYASKDNWNMSEFGSTIRNDDITQIVEVDFIDRYGGKKARTLLKELEIIDK
jgi:hypothetical protein